MNGQKDRQHARLAHIAKELTPGCRVSFRSKGMQDCINDMRVNDARTGAILFTSPDRCYWTAETIKDKSDAEIRQLLLAWMRGKSAP